MTVNNKNNKRIAKNTMFMYMRMFLVMAVSLYTVRVVLQTLGVEDYGVYSAVGGIITSLTFITNVLAIASQRFFAVEIGKGEKGALRDTFSTMVLIYTIVGLLIILFSETVGMWFLKNKMTIPRGRESAALWIFQCTILSFFISVITAPHQAMIIAKEKMNIYAYVGILDVLLKLLLVYLLCVIQFDKLIVYGVLMLSVALICNSIYVVYSLYQYREARLKLIFRPDIFKDILGFSSWTMFGSVTFMCNTQGINLVLNVFFGPAVNAAYAIGNQIKTAINSFSSNFYVAVRPVMMKSYVANDYEYVKKLFYFSSKVIFVLLFVIIFPVTMHIETILDLWLGIVGDYMVEFVILMLVYAIVLSLSDPITTIMQAANKIKYYYLFVDGFTLLSLPLSYVAFKMGASPDFAFIISIIIFAIAHFIRLYLLNRVVSEIKITDYVRHVALPIVLAVVLVLIPSVGLKTVTPNTIVAKGFTFCTDFLLAVSTSLLVVMDTSERKSLIGLVLNKFRKKK